MKNIIKFITANRGTKIMALFLAGVIWFYIYQEYTEQLPPVDVPIKLVLPKGITARIENPEQQDSINSLRVVLAGPRGAAKVPSNLMCRHKIMLPKPIDKSQVLIEKITESDFDLPSTVHIKKIVPDRIRVTLFQEVNTRLRIKTTDCFQGIPEKGYAVVSVKSEPSEIMVKGPKDILDKYVEVPIAQIDITGRKTSFSQAGVIKEILDGEKISSEESFIVTVVIEPEPVEKVLRTKIAAIVLPEFPYKVTITPPEIEVKLKGPKESINKLKESHLNLFVNVGGLYTNLAELKPPMSFTTYVKYLLTDDAPEGIQLAEPLPQIKLDVLKPSENPQPQ